MANIISVNKHIPKIPDSTWLAPDAVITGNVIIGEYCSVWFKSVIRGDVCAIRIGNKSNVQDGAIIHGTYQVSDTLIGDEVSIAHGAIIHGCTINDRVLIGMRAVIMDHAIIESDCIVAAGSVVLQKAHLKSGFIYGGTPAKIIKEIGPEQRQFYITRTAEAYIKYASWYRKTN